MNNTYVPIIVLVVAVLIVGGFLYTLLAVQDNTTQTDETTDTNTEEQTSSAQDVPENWQTYSNDAFAFRFAYPPEGEAQIEAELAKVTYLGPDNTPDSEISDGFTFYVESITVQPEDSLASVADEQFEAMTENRASMQPPTEISVNGEQAYEFKVESELGPVITYVVMEGSSETVLLVAYSVLGDEDGKYQTMVNEMLKTIEMK